VAHGPVQFVAFGPVGLKPISGRPSSHAYLLILKPSLTTLRWQLSS